MKTIILIVVALFLSSPVWAIWPFGDKKEEVKETENPKYCHYSMDVAKGVEYVFRGGCVGFIHVGVIDKIKNKITVIDEDGRMGHEADGFPTDEKRNSYAEKEWGKITPVKDEL